MSTLSYFPNPSRNATLTKGRPSVTSRMEHDWRPCEPVRFDVEDGFTECSIECSMCKAKVPPDWPEDALLKMVWDVPEDCRGAGFVQESMLSEHPVDP
jgi:hypothetical protein